MSGARGGCRKNKRGRGDLFRVVDCPSWASFFVSDYFAAAFLAGAFFAAGFAADLAAGFAAAFFAGAFFAAAGFAAAFLAGAFFAAGFAAAFLAGAFFAAGFAADFAAGFAAAFLAGAFFAAAGFAAAFLAGVAIQQAPPLRPRKRAGLVPEFIIALGAFVYDCGMGASNEYAMKDAKIFFPIIHLRGEERSSREQVEH
jgi:hypothetical protein